MYVIDGIAYAGELPKPVSVKSIRPTDDYELIILFTNGETRRFDFKPLLDVPCYQPLKNLELFRRVYIECGTAAWNDDIDIAPETLYENGVLLSDSETA